MTALRADNPRASRRSPLAWARGLRGRATLAFAVVALVLSTAMALTVWATVSSYLTALRERAAVSQAMTHAEQVQRSLPGPGVSPAQALAQLSREIGSTSLLRTEGRWFTTSLEVGSASLPGELRESTLAGRPLSQRFEVDGRPMLAVGLPLAQGDDAYFEVFPLDELDQTFYTLSTVLAAAALAVPLASLVLGWWALRPALRPLDRVAAAAAAVAAGDLRARMDPRGDPGLESIASSFNDTAAALERRVRSDAQFAADVSHELRSPLTTMVSAVELIESDRASLPPDGREALDLLRSEVTRFGRLVEDLLEISRSDAGSADLVLVEVVLADLVRQTVPSSLQDRLVVTPRAADALACVDKRRLERVVLNLIDNAERHGGGLTRVGVDADEEWAEVSVEDSGPGLDEQERRRIFERFARGRRSGRDSTDGAGLGLSLVARHMHLMNGAVRVENSAAGGARFVVRLPTAEQHPCPTESGDP